MSRSWTKQQSNAINATNGSVLVSAAAGSGKTAVLVERVIKLITRQQNPVDVDRLLIVTFTRAAAAEMQQRISEALAFLLKDDPYNPVLLKQKQLLYNSNISTIDSFCSNIVREYFHTLDISPDFRIADTSELMLIQNDALDKTMEKYYASSNKDFIKLVDAFSSKSGDIKLRETIEKIFTFLSTQPFREKWLDDVIANYGEKPVSDTLWGKIIINYTLSSVKHAQNLSDSSLKALDAYPELAVKMSPAIRDDIDFLALLQSKLVKGNWNEIVKCVCDYTATRLNSLKGADENPIKILVAANRKEVKDTIKLIKSYFGWDEDEAKQEIFEIKSLVITLFDVVRDFIAEFDAEKKAKNLLSFSDVELLTVKLLANPVADGYEKTEQSQEISKRFDYVMVDEFQDVNDVQDLIFKCVSTNENNMFVVGDVKQSIYGFRQAKPQIFINRKNAYNRYDEEKENYPATIILDKNFRSRREVCETVNFIFKNLMTKESAGMDYNNDEFLNTGAVYSESSQCNFELALIEKNAFPDSESMQTEAEYIAKKISEMINSDFCVQDGNKQRKATYGDFAVILRSTKNKAAVYVNTLNDCGIPAYSENKDNAFDSREIKIILNYLRVIDNPTLDIPLLSVMVSPIYGFTPDELAQIRSDNRYCDLYSALQKYGKTNSRAAVLLNDISIFRTLSATCEVEKLIDAVYEKTAFPAITGAINVSDKSVKNLRLLREYARTFESNGSKGLSKFIAYIDRLVENKSELSTAFSSSGDGFNMVKVLSIHGSKGLEFPVCFLAGTAHKFNKTDLKSDILLDSVAGLGIRKKEGFCRCNTLPRLAVALEISQNEMAEELRVLYVALTRAKEKLITVSSQKDVNKYLDRLRSKLVLEKQIDSYTVIKSASISDWLCLCALIYPNLINSDNNKDANDNSDCSDKQVVWNYTIIDKPEMIFDLSAINAFDVAGVAENLSNEKCDDKKIVQLLKRNVDFEYKNEKIINLVQKVSASQIAHEQSNEYFDKVLSKPVFLNSIISTATERGTAHHRLLQYCNFENARNDVDAEIVRLLNEGLILRRQADCIDREKIREFMNSQLVKRIIESPCVMREERFSAKLAPCDIFDEYKDVKTDSFVIIQGAVDLAFVEDSALVIVDYKTDMVKSIDRLAELYSKQLILYKKAMEQCTELKVKECIICSIHLNSYITI